MKILSEEDLKIIENNENYIKFENKKALFFTKIECSIRHNDEVVDVLGVLKGKNEEDDFYIVRFNDDTIGDNIMNIELNFDYTVDKTYMETRKILSKIMKKYELSDKEAEELYNASINYDYEANEGTIFTTVDSIKSLFTEEESVERINPSINQLKAMAEYIKETKDYYMLYCYEKYTKKIISLILNEDENAISRLEFLNEIKDMINHNIICYSKNSLFSEAKPGFEKEFVRENRKLILVEQMIKEEKQKDRDKKHKEREVR